MAGLHRHNRVRIRRPLVWRTIAICPDCTTQINVHLRAQERLCFHIRHCGILFRGILLGIIHCLRTIANRAQPLFFATLYLFYKYITPRSARVDLRDLTSSYYVLDDLQSVEQNRPNALNNKPSNITSPSTAATAVELESTHNLGFGNMARAWGSEQVKHDYEISPEMLDEIETQRAGAEERARIRTILEVRPVRWENGFWREMWSFIVTRERSSNRV